MGDVVKSLFGGTDDSAQKAQIRANARTEGTTRELGDLARADVRALFPASQINQQRASQAALDVFGQSIPEQLSVFRQGNVGAQRALSRALPQFQNALLGDQIDFSQFAPQKLKFDASFARQQLPTFATGTGPAAAARARGLPPPQAAPQFSGVAQGVFGGRGGPQFGRRR